MPGRPIPAHETRCWRAAAAMAALICLVAWPAPAAAAAPSPAAPAALAAAAEATAWLDPFVAEQMAALHIPGAAVVLVQAGRVTYSRGFGHADLERGVAVDPDATVFRAMSVSKPVTATAILQLVEQDTVRLDADVTTYLTRTRVPATFPQPITIAHLLTHTAGLDYDLDEIGTIARRPADVQPLADYLAAHPTARIAPPGQRLLYSNAAYDLLGLVVEEVTGRPFADYADEHLLRPLGMTRSSFRERPAAELAVSYRWEDDAFQPVAPHAFSDPPARGLTTTAADMGRFLLAHLRQGRADGGPILRPATVELMHRRQYAAHPAAAGVAYGFATAQLGDQRALWHDGFDADRASSLLALFLDRDLGYFVATNSGDARLATALATEIDRRLTGLSAPPPLPTPPADFDARAGRYTGVYRSTEYAHRTIAKADLLRRDDFPWVEAPGDGTLVLRFAADVPPTVLVEAAPGVFRAVGLHVPVVFLDGAGGRPAVLLWGTGVYERIPWRETSAAQRGLAAAFAAVFLAATLAWPIAALARRRRGEHPPTGRADRLAGLVAWLVAALNLAILVGLAATLARADELGLEYGLPRALAGLLLVPPVTAVLAAGLLAWTVVAWRRRAWPTTGRLAFTAFALVAAAFVPFLRHWNLLSGPW